MVNDWCNARFMGGIRGWGCLGAVVMGCVVYGIQLGWGCVVSGLVYLTPSGLSSGLFSVGVFLASDIHCVCVCARGLAHLVYLQETDNYLTIRVYAVQM